MSTIINKEITLTYTVEVDDVTDLGNAINNIIIDVGVSKGYKFITGSLKLKQISTQGLYEVTVLGGWDINSN